MLTFLKNKIKLVRLPKKYKTIKKSDVLQKYEPKSYYQI